MGIEQVNAAVSSIDETTQQNAALAEQTMASSAAMSERADVMNQRLNFFSLDDQWQQDQQAVMDEPETLNSSWQASAAAAGIDDNSEKSQVQSAVPGESEQAVQPIDMDLDDGEWEEF